jgi:hypothetical protein
MSTFRNVPQLRDNDGEQKIKRYVHSPLTVEHHGVNAAITENGKVVLSKVARVVDKETVEYDEIEIPASLVFKLASLLKATRKVKYVTISELSTLGNKTVAVEEEQEV